MADLFARKIKKSAMPESIEMITTRRLKIPQFIPLAIGESDAPKQVAHAIAEGDVIKKTSRLETTNFARLINS